MKKIHVFYITKLSGHYKVAQNICATFRKEFPDTEIHFINLFQFLFPRSERIVDCMYTITIKLWPSLWHWMYDRKTVVKSLSPIHKVVKLISLYKMDRLFHRGHPDIVITTQAFPCGLVSFYKAKRNLDFKLFACVTDYLPHGFWLEDNVDYFIVPSKEATDYFLRRGVPDRKVLNFGIPVHEKFFEDNHSPEIYQRLGLKEGIKKVLIMGGGQGLGPIPKTVRYLNKLRHDFEIIVVCGRNRWLVKRLSSMKHKKKVVVLGYVDYVHKLMDVSDIIITKPGGVTLTEALFKGLCILVLKPLPGQEMNNTYFLKKNKIADIAFSPKKAVLKVKRFLDHPRFLAARKERALKFHPGHSSLRIARFIKEVSD